MGTRLRFITPLLRVFFNLLYHQFAWTYDFVAAIVSIGMWKEWVFSTIRYLTAEKILEIGHGPGHLQIALAKKVRMVVGIDSSRQMGQICAKRMIKRGNRANLANSKAQNLPFPDNTFDKIISTFPTPYIFELDTISEIHRVLIPGGEFIFLPIAWITGRNIHQRFASWLFKVTGQTSEEEKNLYMEGLKQYKQIGFNTSYEIINLEDSKVLILRVTKVVV